MTTKICYECNREFGAHGWHHHERLHRQADLLQPALYHLAGLSAAEIQKLWGVSRQVARIWERRARQLNWQTCALRS